MSRRDRFDDRKDRSRHRLTERELYLYYMRKKEEKQRIERETEEFRKRPHSDRQAPDSARGNGALDRRNEASDDHLAPAKQRRRDNHGVKPHNRGEEKGRSPRHRSPRRRRSRDRQDNLDDIPKQSPETKEDKKPAPPSSSVFLIEEYSDDVFADDLGLEEDNVNVEAMCEAAMLSVNDEGNLDDLLECAEEVDDTEETFEVLTDDDAVPHGSDGRSHSEDNLTADAIPSSSADVRPPSGNTKTVQSDSNGVDKKKGADLSRRENRDSLSAGNSKSAESCDEEHALVSEKMKKKVNRGSHQNGGSSSAPVDNHGTEETTEGPGDDKEANSLAADGSRSARASKKDEHCFSLVGSAGQLMAKPGDIPESARDAMKQVDQAKRAHKRIIFDIQGASEDQRFSPYLSPQSNSDYFPSKPTNKREFTSNKPHKIVEESKPIEAVAIEEEPKNRPRDVAAPAKSHWRTDAYGPALAFFAKNRRATNPSQRNADEPKRQRQDDSRRSDNQSWLNRETARNTYYDMPISAGVLHKRGGHSSGSSRHGSSSSRIILH
ncbi:hypothetical protein QR680_005643 [Steinernema hermaphroditum]|uniref:Uncharacterized protein n=1 Tax=Steinernema hermaphroditum TaxID=289476 RepID=A0AA39HU76_9BILA|nr:hypothetical protein QR680_005643 [Steinernema hermaphroditum]